MWYPGLAFDAMHKIKVETREAPAVVDAVAAVKSPSARRQREMRHLLLMRAAHSDRASQGVAGLTPGTIPRSVSCLA
jgi:hypothetical protein